MANRPAIDPVRWTPPPAPPNPDLTRLGALRVYPVPGFGAEDVLVDTEGRVLTGVDDGRILRVDPDSGAVEQVADTGGRPLGLEWLPDGRVLVCDARRGVLAVDLADGTSQVLADSADGRPLTFCNNAAVAADGTVYVSDSSSRFGIEHWRAELFEHSDTGRVVRIDPSGQTTVVADGLEFPNGLALDRSGDWLAIAETSAYRVRRLWLTGSRSGTVDRFVDNLAGFPDNISTGADGLVWIALASPRNPVLDSLLPRHPLLRRIAWAIPERLQPQPGCTVHVVAVDATGTVVREIAGESPDYHLVTGVRQVDGRVWFGSLQQSAIAMLER